MFCWGKKTPLKTTHMFFTIHISHWLVWRCLKKLGLMLQSPVYHLLYMYSGLKLKHFHFRTQFLEETGNDWGSGWLLWIILTASFVLEHWERLGYRWKYGKIKISFVFCPRVTHVVVWRKNTAEVFTSKVLWCLSLTIVNYTWMLVWLYVCREKQCKCGRFLISDQCTWKM